MRAWLFEGSGNLTALCVDDAGSVLPNEHGPWTRLRHIDLDHAGDDEEQARSLLLEHGYCCFMASTDA